MIFNWGIVIIIVGLLSASSLSDPQQDVMASFPLIDTSKAPAFSEYNYNNRVQQWKNYYISRETIDDERRAFYYNIIYKMLLNADFDSSEAAVYAEIPGIESDWSSIAVSWAGAIGLWQVMPNTAASYGVSREELFDPVINTKVAIKYLLYLNRRFHGDVAKVLFAYNAGPYKVSRYLTRYDTMDAWKLPFNRKEQYEYAPKVLGAYLARN